MERIDTGGNSVAEFEIEQCQVGSRDHFVEAIERAIAAEVWAVGVICKAQA